jgi:nitronate monooxygenase
VGIATRLTERLGIRHPILLAPMAVVAGGRLAAAVTAAGGLGLIGGGYGDAGWLEQQFAAAGNHRVGCGFITWSLARQPHLLDVALAHRPAVVMLSFGDPRPFGPRIKAAGAQLLCQVQTLARLREAIAAARPAATVPNAPPCPSCRQSPTRWRAKHPKPCSWRQAALPMGAVLPQR